MFLCLILNYEKYKRDIERCRLFKKHYAMFLYCRLILSYGKDKSHDDLRKLFKKHYTMFLNYEEVQMRYRRLQEVFTWQISQDDFEGTILV